MKKVLKVIICGVLLLSLTACGTNNKDDDSGGTIDNATLTKNIKIIDHEAFFNSSDNQKVNPSVIVILKNNNNVIVKISYSVNFYDNSNNLLKETKVNYYLGKNSEYATVSTGNLCSDSNYNHYEISNLQASASESDNWIDYTDKVKIDSEIVPASGGYNKYLDISAINNSGDSIKQLSVTSICFNSKNKIIYAINNNPSILVSGLNQNQTKRLTSSSYPDEDCTYKIYHIAMNY